jgi:hypothetical protein
MEAEMKAIFAALASAALLAGTMSSISTPAAAQARGGGGFHGGGFHGGGGFRGGGGFHGAAGGFRGGGFRGGHHRDHDGVGFVFGLPFGDPYYYDDPYGYDDAWSYDDGASACGAWTWDDTRGRYVWIPC